MRRKELTIWWNFCHSSRLLGKKKDRLLGKKKIDKYFSAAKSVGYKDEVSVVASDLGMAPKRLEVRLGKLGIRERIETIQTTTLLKSA